ncbi:unnamed protein product [Musa banksii]
MREPCQPLQVMAVEPIKEGEVIPMFHQFNNCSRLHLVTLTAAGNCSIVSKIQYTWKSLKERGLAI